MHPRPPRSGPPIGFAHRGGRAGGRENTLVAFARALEIGATGLESDAWLTADGQVVLDHDGTTGCLWRRRRFNALRRAALPPHVPTLDELYRACGADFELSLDIKDPAALPGVLGAAGAAGAAGRLWLCHHDVGLLARWRAQLGDAGGPLLVNSMRLRHVREGLGARLAALADARIDALNLHRSDWTPERVAQVRAAGLWSFAWDVQSGSDIARLLAAGVDGVYSDHVGRLMSAIAQRTG